MCTVFAESEVTSLVARGRTGAISPWVCTNPKIPDLIRRAYEHRNAARHLLVKGRIDYVAGPQGAIATIDSPSEEALEPIGGTGDTLTGLASALICGGFDIDPAAVLAAQANRIAGRLAAPTPMTQVAEIIARIPQAMAQVLEKR